MEKEKNKEKGKEKECLNIKKRLEDKIRKSKVETKCIIEMYRNNQMMMMGLQKKGEGTTSSGEC